jgi:hypothetical protein
MAQSEGSALAGCSGVRSSRGIRARNRNVGFGTSGRAQLPILLASDHATWNGRIGTHGQRPGAEIAAGGPRVFRL